MAIIYVNTFIEEVILAEERTTEEEKMHIMEGIDLSTFYLNVLILI